jgi:hypothetical protein
MVTTLFKPEEYQETLPNYLLDIKTKSATERKATQLLVFKTRINKHT